MNRSIIAQEEMINVTKKTQRSRASLLHRMLSSAQRTAVLLALLLLTTGAGSAWAQDTTWDGTEFDFKEKDFVIESLAVDGHDGKSWENAYVITTARQLAYFAWIIKNNKEGRGSAYYWKLGANINLNSKNWVFGGNTGGAFQGHFDGDNHTISNLALTVDNNSNFGLFTTIQGANATDKLAEVKNLNISGVTFTSAASRGANTRLGTLTGTAKQANISNINVSNVTFTYTGGISAENDLGGVIGYTEAATTVSNVTVSGVTATFTGTTTNLYVAGLIGKINGQTAVTNCSTSNVSITYNDIANASRISGLVGWAKGASATAQTTITKCSVSGTNIQLTKGINNVSYIGALLAQGTTSTVLGDGTDNTVSSPIINIAGEIKGSSYIGGAIGDFAGAANNTSIINKLNVTTPSVTVNKVSVKDCYIGGVFGRINTYTDVKAVNVTTKTSANTLEYKADGSTNFSLFLGTFAGGVTGVAAQKTLVSDIDVTGDAQLTIGTGSNNANNIKAGLIGQVTTHVDLKDLDIANSKITVKGNLAAVSYIGGIVGYTASAANAPTTIDDVTLTGTSSVSVTGNVSTANNLIGSAFGDIVGVAGATTTVSNITIPTATLTFGTSNSNSVVGVKAGLVGQIITNVDVNTWSITNNTVTINGDIKTTAANVGGFVGYATTANNGPVNISGVTFSGTNTVNVTNKVSVASMIGGFAGYLKSAKSATVLNAELEVTGNTLGTTNVTVGNDANADNTSVGGFVGQMEAAKLSQSNVTAAAISINGNLTNNIYVGGLVGQLVQSIYNSIIERCSVSGSIKTASGKTFAKSKNYAFGGIVGYAPHTAPSATAAKISTVQNCVSEVNIDLGSLTPVSGSISGQNYNFKKHGLVAGGVIGMMYVPVQLPENLFYSGKINAPLAVVAPIVGTFLSNIDAAAYVYDDYSGFNALYLTPAEWEKAKTWYYNGYKIGLSSDVTTQTARTKNYTGTPAVDNGVNYLEITDAATSFTQGNTITGIDKISRTVLAYNIDNKNQDYGIYPKWSTDAASYPKYYMYYMQGVNRGEYVETSTVATLKSEILAGAGMMIDMSLVDLNGDANVNANRGVIEHTLTISTTADGVTYKWYVDGVEQSGTSAEFHITPALEGNSVMVEGIKDAKVAKRLYYNIRPVFRVKDPSAAIYGTKDNPYLIGKASDLQLLSHLSTLPTNIVWEKTYKSSDHYNRAYYEMDADVDMSGIADFTPIGFPKSNDTGGVISGYSQNFVFDGIFDGKGHTISNLKETWYAGALNTNDQNIGWGLFSAVGNVTAQKKVGESVASQAIIRNLVIVDARLTHKPDNTSFYYNNGTSGNANNCMIGVLAGIVSSNTKIQNIVIRNSIITDGGSGQSYKLATKGLYVGGAIGSLQKQFNGTDNLPAGAQIHHVAAQVDITLTHAAFTNDTKPAEVSLLNVGGIIGRVIATKATLATIQGVMPAYTLYSGTINAPKAWISPVVAAVRASEQNGGDWKNFSKQWEGNNGSAATQISVTNAQYYNFKIGTDTKTITDAYPVNICNIGSHSMAAHIDASEQQSTYNASKYQGVNYGARYLAENVSLALLNAEYDEYRFAWDDEPGFVYLTKEVIAELSLTRASGTNELTVGLDGAEPTSYKWEVSFDAENWITVDGETEDTYNVPVSLKTKYVKAIVTVGTKKYTSLIEIINADKDLYQPKIERDESGANAVFTLNLNAKTLTPAPQLTTTYQWYKSTNEAIAPEVKDKSLTLTKTVLASNEYDNTVWCKVVVTESGVEVATYWLMNGTSVVFVNGDNYTKKGCGAGDDNNDGLSPSTPVKTLDKAYEKLKGTTVEDNIIVVMGVLNPDYKFQNSNTTPATLTGRYKDIDYEGVIRLMQVDPSGSEHNVNPIGTTPKAGSNCYVLGDTKFQYLKFYGKQQGNTFIELHGKDVTFGKGLVMENFAKLSKSHGNMGEKENIPEFTILLTATNLCDADIQRYTTGRTKPQVVTFQSGHYGRLMGGRFTQNFFAKNENTAHSILGSAANPVWAVINVDIEEGNGDGTAYTRDINAIIAGLTDGTMYGDYTINFHGGNVAYIVGANQGNPVNNGSKNYTPLGGRLAVEKKNSKGVLEEPAGWGEWPNASYFGRTVINVEQKDGIKDITIGNLYAGGLGRMVQADNALATVDMYVYGRTEVNVKSGTIAGNVYGGGVGGVIGVNPWDAHVPYATTAVNDANQAILNKVQYGDNRFGITWSSMTTESPMAEVVLHNLNAAGDGYVTENLDLRNSSTTVNVSGGTVNGNVYGGGYGFVQDMPLYAAMQGIGSVFGTTNVNITGGTINGNIYGGSQGSSFYYGGTNKYGQTVNHIAEMNGTVNMRISGTEEKWPTIKGDIYGGGQGIESTNTEEYPRIATTGNADLGDQYKSTINITIDMPDSKVIEGNVFGGGQLGAVDGDINVVINGGTINGNVYGGGKGEKNHLQKARVNGTTNVTLGY